ncbi:MAG: PAS domain S-box protein [Methanomassiliicoccus sp.]|nr:PAS domain S-box protein [Methanomassiliicoccus sp.]
MEARRKISTDRLEQIIELANEGIWVLDSTILTSYINGRGAAILGYAPEEMLGHPPTDFASPDRDEEAERKLSEVWRGRPQSCEYPLRHRDGSTIWTLCSARPIMDEDENFKGALAVFMDITEKRKASESLRRSEERFRAMVTASSDYIYRLSPDLSEIYQLHYRDLQPGTDRRFSTWIEEHIPSEDHQRFLEEMEKAVRTRSVLVIDLRFISASRRYRWFLARAVPIFDADGNVTEWFGTAKDITESKEAEEALKRSNKRFELLSETNAILLSSRDPMAVIQSIAGRVIRHLDCDVFFNYFFDEFGSKLHLNAYYGISRHAAREVEWLEPGTSISGRVALEGTAIVSEDMQNSDATPASMLRSLGIQAFACHPIRVGGCTMGTLAFGTRDRPRFEEDEVTLMRMVTEQVSVSIKRRRAELAVKDREEHLARAQRIAHMGSWEWEVDNDRLYLSDEAYRIIGQHPTRSPVPSDFALSFIHSEDRGRVASRLKMAVTEGSYNIEYRVIRKDGEVRHVREQGEISLGGQEAPLRLAGTVHDITDQRRVEKELEESRKRFQALIEMSADFMWETDAEGRYTYCSPQVERFWGIKPEVMLGRTPFDGMPPKMGVEMLEQFLRPTADSTEARNLRASTINAVGEPMCVEINGAPFFDEEGRLLGFRGTTRNVTEARLKSGADR